MEACAYYETGNVNQDANTTGFCASLTWIDDACWLKNASALVGSSNTTAQMYHASASPAPLQQSANLIIQNGSIV